MPLPRGLKSSIQTIVDTLTQLIRNAVDASNAFHRMGMRAVIRQLMTSAPREAPGPLRRWTWRLGAASTVIVTAGILSSGYTYGPLTAGVIPGVEGDSKASVSRREVSLLGGEQKKLKARLARLVPNGVYIVVDQTHNRLYLRKNDDILLEAVCSAGSGMVLKESSSGGRKWVFDTPRGSFEVLGKTENPVWRKPDWAFIEEGLPVPEDPSERIEYGALGSYALHFGNGYMIHGTLYERLLGRSVTHGCIRLGQESLRKVYMSCPIGTHIYVF